MPLRLESSRIVHSGRRFGWPRRSNSRALRTTGLGRPEGQEEYLGTAGKYRNVGRMQALRSWSGALRLFALVAGLQGGLVPARLRSASGEVWAKMLSRSMARTVIEDPGAGGGRSDGVSLRFRLVRFVVRCGHGDIIAAGRADCLAARAPRAPWRRARRACQPPGWRASPGWP